VREAIAGVGDEEARIALQTRLHENLEVVNLNAVVEDGVARLYGTVRTESDHLRAAEIARATDGVRLVFNEMRIDATAADDPSFGNSGGTLETAVAAELRRDPVLATRDIRVVADRRSNTVTLIGVVASQAERERAARVAADAFSAGNVRNSLQVGEDF
jgi:osmotically-inducible protein OsmY